MSKFGEFYLVLPDSHVVICNTSLRLPDRGDYWIKDHNCKLAQNTLCVIIITNRKQRNAISI